MPNRFLRNTSLLSLALLLGRVSGLARELCISSILGLTKEADITILLLTFPDLITGLLLSGGFNIAFIAELKNLPAHLTKPFFFQVLVLLGLVAFFGCLILYFWPHLWLKIIGPNISFLEIKNFQWVIGLVVFSIPIAMMSCVLTAYLNAYNQFFISGLGTLFFNGAVIISLLTLYLCLEPTTAVAIGIFCGTLSRFAIQWLSQPPYTKRSFFTQFLISKHFIKNFSLVSLSIFIPLLLPFLMRASFSFIGGGQIATFSYALKIVELPLGIFITNIGIVLYPFLCESLKKHDDSFLASQKIALQKVLLLSITFLFHGYLFGQPILEVIYARGNIRDIRPIFEGLSTLLWILPFIGYSSIYTAQLNALRKLKTILKANLYALSFLIIGSIVAITQSSSTGLYLSLLGFHILYAFQVRKQAKIIPFWGRFFKRSLIKIGCITCIGYAFSLIPNFKNNYLQCLIGGLSGLLTLYFISQTHISKNVY